ncbi:hypothetical protein F2Q69_00035107 [Brassica cretica]|uniref:Uncharacterized protein n=1 Tax=Brassica cretica TaxID=69181 RepID=A0A8S9SGC8_BRACR|nr:hypothetical protein F2Q69_00035107 [Brassica cretica]
MERNPRIKILPSASLHGLTILPLMPRSVGKSHHLESLPDYPWHLLIIPGYS